MSDDDTRHLQPVPGIPNVPPDRRAAAMSAVAERERKRSQALQLRMAGMSYRKIAEEVGFGDQHSAREAVQATMLRHEAKDVDELRALENERYDRAQAAIWPDVLQGNLQALDRFIRLSERRSKLNGMDAPQQIQVTPGSEPVQVWVSRVLGLEGHGDVVEAEVVDWGDG